MLFPQLRGKYQGKTRKDRAQTALYHIICVVRLLFVLFYVVFVCNCVLPPGDNPIAVNKYIIYHMYTQQMVYCVNPMEKGGFLGQYLKRKRDATGSCQ
jgi:hypothetical protein